MYHTAGDTVIGRYDYARLVCDVFDLDSSMLVPITTAELNQPAPRPLKAGLLMDHFKQDFPNVHVLSAREGREVNQGPGGLDVEGIAARGILNEVPNLRRSTREYGTEHCVILSRRLMTTVHLTRLDMVGE